MSQLTVKEKNRLTFLREVSELMYIQDDDELETQRFCDEANKLCSPRLREYKGPEHAGDALRREVSELEARESLTMTSPALEQADVY